VFWWPRAVIHRPCVDQDDPACAEERIRRYLQYFLSCYKLAGLCLGKLVCKRVCCREHIRCQDLITTPVRQGNLISLSPHNSTGWNFSYPISICPELPCPKTPTWLSKPCNLNTVGRCGFYINFDGRIFAIRWLALWKDVVV
jgi:hypothetical protein